MNKSELIAALAEKSNQTKADAGRVLDALTDIIQATVASGDTIALIGFGTFDQKARVARVGRNPRTGAELKIAASITPRFKPGAKFKAAVAGK